MIRRPPRSTRTDTLFPSRRSSDLHDALEQRTAQQNFEAEDAPRLLVRQLQRVLVDLPARVPQDPHRSEEHTSELQSLMRISYAVFCLKKKKNTKTTHSTAKHNTHSNKHKSYNTTSTKQHYK